MEGFLGEGGVEGEERGLVLEGEQGVEGAGEEGLELVVGGGEGGEGGEQGGVLGLEVREALGFHQHDAVALF